MRVGFVGAGRMGRPMVDRLLAGGHDVRALGRTSQKRSDLERLGARAVHDVAQAGARADVVVLCVFTDQQVREVCLDGGLLSAMPDGSALVVHTTASPKTIHDLAARADGVDVVDATVSGGPHDIAESSTWRRRQVPSRRSSRWPANSCARTWPSCAASAPNSAPRDDVIKSVDVAKRA